MNKYEEIKQLEANFLENKRKENELSAQKAKELYLSLECLDCKEILGGLIKIEKKNLRVIVSFEKANFETLQFTFTPLVDNSLLFRDYGFSAYFSNTHKNECCNYSTLNYLNLDQVIGYIFDKISVYGY